ncbi:MAG: transcription antitermination factor NusB [Nitrospirota bacterium]|nr:MAG: transcription antitermination factor NusB [Nitrospirota bacterium]
MKRRLARGYVLQLLFQYDFTHRDPDALISEFWEGKKADNNIIEFTNGIFKGTVENIKAIDNIIKGTAEHWVLERMAIVDRNILRLAAYEIIYRDDIPPAVSMDEAIEIAKKYSSMESSSFINGILDKISRKHQRAAN